MNERSQVCLKRIYEPVDENDGARILVDRMWPRGVSKEQASLTEWMKDIAPSAELRHWFDHNIEKWPSFQHLYFQELGQEHDAVARLMSYVRAGSPITLLYAAHDEKHNNAVALKEYLNTLGPW
ncbi:DUF488 domain-containing protein [Aliirhizobium cellulosilyticum]|uniref:Uncharacterized protein YeaO (DUF488 family) n=1 Tax=Aliirhizobium cellulosilyticum TaxID=393664 RepID=A0A7W6WPX5_9HYPH|nr:uncharacterized protein YeaO (DUF488 family) [Rhizobium cellulosilyticum]MBB4412439.1 uncharacterized protein YeaO (DUF488 family) [Rhizobium cellulosilyticum]MBB4447071.1 uncharacterized protein YeaO (DUF488 family) [Rhizobium cellulosilyticum]